MGSKSKSSPPQVTPEMTSSDIMKARQQYELPAQQLAFDVATDPTSGIGAYTNYLRGVQSQAYGPETELRDALLSTFASQLQSPSGITPEQQAAQEAIRARETQRLQESMRTRANLGGGLFGGRAAAAESRDVGNLAQAFSAEDINRDAAQRQALYQNIIASLSQFLPQVGIQNVSYQSPVVDPNTAYQGAINQRQLEMQKQEQDQAARNALYQSLFQGLGTAAAAALAPATGGASLLAMPGLTSSLSGTAEGGGLMGRYQYGPGKTAGGYGLTGALDRGGKNAIWK